MHADTLMKTRIPPFIPTLNSHLSCFGSRSQAASAIRREGDRSGDGLFSDRSILPGGE